MRRTAAAAVIIALALVAAPAAAQTIPVEALAAEGQGRWREALNIYQQVLEREPGRADLWVRVSDIHARLGQIGQSLAALEAAVHARQDDPALHARLSRAYAAADRPEAALAVIRTALALQPDEPAYLKACGELASWAGDYAAARQCYEGVVRVAPGDSAALLALARVHAWNRESNRAAKSYREYLLRVPGDQAAWLEAARVESWRGNDRGAYALLQTYRSEFGEPEAYRREMAAVLTRGHRPGQALRVLRPLLSSGAPDYELNLAQALAYSEYGHGEKAHRAYEAASALAPERKETNDLQRQLRIAFGSLLQPSAVGYGDSDGLRSYRMPLAVSVALASSFRLQAGYERQELRARQASGLERVDGARSVRLDRGWMGAEARPLPHLTLRAQAGRQDSTFRNEWTYTGGAALRLGDRLRVEYDREHALMTISPRAVSLGLVHDIDRVRVGWAPSFFFAVDLDASREALSDGNERRAVRAAPRLAVVRNQWLNLDLGGSAYVFAADLDLDHGYYDPVRYELYGLTLLPYFKLSENHGLSVFIEAGMQKDEHRDFEPGGSAAFELTLGIYQAWMLKLNGSATINSRLDSGAFRGYSGALVLTRRF